MYVVNGEFLEKAKQLMIRLYILFYLSKIQVSTYLHVGISNYLHTN